MIEILLIEKEIIHFFLKNVKKLRTKYPIFDKNLNY
jgi:hypothetical protein